MKGLGIGLCHGFQWRQRLAFVSWLLICSVTAHPRAMSASLEEQNDGLQTSGTRMDFSGSSSETEKAGQPEGHASSPERRGLQVIYGCRCEYPGEGVYHAYGGWRFLKKSTSQSYSSPSSEDLDFEVVDGLVVLPLFHSSCRAARFVCHGEYKNCESWKCPLLTSGGGSYGYHESGHRSLKKGKSSKSRSSKDSSGSSDQQCRRIVELPERHPWCGGHTIPAPTTKPTRAPTTLTMTPSTVTVVPSRSPITDISVEPTSSPLKTNAPSAKPFRIADESQSPSFVPSVDHSAITSMHPTAKPSSSLAPSGTGNLIGVPSTGSTPRPRSNQPSTAPSEAQSNFTDGPSLIPSTTSSSNQTLKPVQSTAPVRSLAPSVIPSTKSSGRSVEPSVTSESEYPGVVPFSGVPSLSGEPSLDVSEVGPPSSEHSTSPDRSFLPTYDGMPIYDEMPSDEAMPVTGSSAPISPSAPSSPSARFSPSAPFSPTGPSAPVGWPSVALSPVSVAECPSSELVTIDFNSSPGGDLTEGDRVQFEWFSTYGFVIFGFLNDDRVYRPADGSLAIFDTMTPGDSPELGSPNENCSPTSGAGIGNGGIPGQMGENCVPQRNVLIIQKEDTDRPVCRESGGNMTFQFLTLQPNIIEIGLLSIHEDNDAFIETKNAAGINVTPIQGLGANSLQDVGVYKSGVQSLTLSLTGCGAIRYLTLCGGMGSNSATPSGDSMGSTRSPSVAPSSSFHPSASVNSTGEAGSFKPNGSLQPSSPDSPSAFRGEAPSGAPTGKETPHSLLSTAPIGSSLSSAAPSSIFSLSGMPSTGSGVPGASPPSSNQPSNVLGLFPPSSGRPSSGSSAVPSVPALPTDSGNPSSATSGAPSSPSEITSLPTSDRVFCERPVMIDFSLAEDDSFLVHGDYVKYEWFKTQGVIVSAVARNGRYALEGKARIFDTSLPGEASEILSSLHLGSPNKGCSPPGLGIGVGGQPGQPGENCERQGNVLILQQHDKNIPGDNSKGGNITFSFDIPALRILNIGLMGLSEQGSNFIEGVAADQERSILIKEIVGLGENSIQEATFDLERVEELTVSFDRRGAVRFILFCQDPSVPVLSWPSVNPSQSPIESLSPSSRQKPTAAMSDAPANPTPTTAPSRQDDSSGLIPTTSEAPNNESIDAPSLDSREIPSSSPSEKYKEIPSIAPSNAPTENPSYAPSNTPSDESSQSPSNVPSDKSSDLPSNAPSDKPSQSPSDFPSHAPSDKSSQSPSDFPSDKPSKIPSHMPSIRNPSPTAIPLVGSPSPSASNNPSQYPSHTLSRVPQSTSEVPSTGHTTYPVIISTFPPVRLPTAGPLRSSSNPSTYSASVAPSLTQSTSMDNTAASPSGQSSQFPSIVSSRTPKSTPHPSTGGATSSTVNLMNTFLQSTPQKGRNVDRDRATGPRQYFPFRECEEETLLELDTSLGVNGESSERYDWYGIYGGTVVSTYTRGGGTRIIEFNFQEEHISIVSIGLGAVDLPSQVSISIQKSGCEEPFFIPVNRGRIGQGSDLNVTINQQDVTDAKVSFTPGTGSVKSLTFCLDSFS